MLFFNLHVFIITGSGRRKFNLTKRARNYFELYTGDSALLLVRHSQLSTGHRLSRGFSLFIAGFAVPTVPYFT